MCKTSAEEEIKKEYENSKRKRMDENRELMICNTSLSGPFGLAFVSDVRMNGPTQYFMYIDVHRRNEQISKRKSIRTL